MAELVHRRLDCRGCASGDLDLVFSLKPSPIGDAFVTAERVAEPQPSYPIDLYMCRCCGLAQLLDVVDPSVLYGDYIYVTASSLGLADHFDEYAAGVIERCNLTKGDLVVDIGSNDGTLLSSFQRNGMTVLGVEPAPHIAANANARGIKTVASYFTPELSRQLVTQTGHARLITANNVLANIDDLRSFVEAVDLLLAQDGVFVFESSYLADLLENSVFDFIYHEHISSFSLKPIQVLFKLVGMEVVLAQHVATKGGSLRYFIQRSGGPMTRDGSVERVQILEEESGLYRKETYTRFAQTVDGLKSETRRFLARAKSEGKSIAGFGASITGTTLIYHFEIGEYLEYLVDDNLAKQGRYSPGFHIPVLPTQALYERKPDYVVALAWRYVDAFVGKNRAYLAAGGQVIVPAPKFRVITNV